MKIALGLLALGLASVAQADVYRLTFDAVGFADIAGTEAAPTNQISGYLEWEGPTQFAPISSLVGVDLTIDGHSYALGDLAFLNGLETTSVIGGSVGGGSNFITAGTFDFALAFDRKGQFYNLIYTVPGVNTSWIGRDATVSIQGAALPEPTSLGLLLAAIAGMGVSRRRDRQAR